MTKKWKNKIFNFPYEILYIGTDTTEDEKGNANPNNINKLIKTGLKSKPSWKYKTFLFSVFFKSVFNFAKIIVRSNVE